MGRSVAANLLRPLTVASNALLAVVVVILAQDWEELGSVGPSAAAAILLFSVSSFALGWVLGSPGEATRRALAVCTTERNIGLAFLVVLTSFPDRQVAAAAVLAAGVCMLLVNLGFALVVWLRAR